MTATKFPLFSPYWARVILAFAFFGPVHAGLINADFTGGNGTASSDQVPGMAGSGWSGPWTSGNLPAANISFAATASPELSAGAGTHLRAEVTAVNAGASVGRVFVNTNGTTGVDGTKPVTIRFDFRLDAANTGFTGSSEHVTLNGNAGLVSSSGSSTWLIRIPAGTSPQWQFYNGNRDSGGYNAALLVNSGMSAVPGVTYSFTLSLVPSTRTYSVTVSNGTATATVNNLGFRSSATTLGDTFGLFAQKDSAADVLAFALDRLEISGETPPPPPPPPSTFPYVFDMVHHNPGEAYYQSQFNDPVFTRDVGYNGKVFFLFESPQLAINWDSFDVTGKVILPAGSADRAWVDAKRAEITPKFDAAKAAGLQVYAMSDLILFPKRLVSLYGLSTTMGNVTNADTELWLRRTMNLMFTQFPQLDGIMVRIGETYLLDAPYHQGKIDNISNATATIIPLMNILRDEVCVKLGKKIFFRTWNSFDTNLTTFLAVSAGVEPHANLVWSVKHVEGDFHRGNPFSKVMGQGRHPFIVEVQCAREYEGKGAFPNYVANGVIEGFEEHAANSAQSLRYLWQNAPLMRGVWTWSRGGGWRGPYIQNEVWCELNAWVMAQWALAPATSEETLFNRFATERLGLPVAQLPAFRRLALLSAEAVWRWKRATNNGLTAGWSRDQYYTFPNLPASASAQAIVLADQDAAVARFREIVELSRTLTPANPADREFIESSCLYGLRLLEIMRTVVNLKAAELSADAFRTKAWIDRHDEAWTAYLDLANLYPASISTPYIRNAWQTWGGENPTTAEPRLRTTAVNIAAAYATTDGDSDGLSDASELGRYWDQPFDTNHDGIPDYQQSAFSPRPYDFWTQTYFNRNYADASLAGPAADPDSDAFPNQLEYALLGDPTLSDASLLSLAQNPSSGALSFTFARNPACDDLDLTIEESTDFVIWNPLARSSAGAPFISLQSGWTVLETPATREVSVEGGDSFTAPRQFLRIKTTITP